MSIPALAAAGAPVGTIGPLQLGTFDAALMSLNSNPYFIGTMMLLLNLGGRFIGMEVSKGQEQFFQNPWVRRLLIFVVLFVGTRNVLVAFWMTLIIVLCIGYLFNENSSLCLFDMGAKGSSCRDTASASTAPAPTPSQMQAQMTPSTPFTPEEAEIYKRLTEKHLKFAANQRHQETRTPAEFPGSLRDVYTQNMNLLRGVEGFAAGSGGGANPRF
jgi:hypothetical protein